jgi:phage replication O-like protein O
MVNGGADIQPENGFVRIHPAILELLATQTLSGREFRCLMFLFRKTYGYHKKQDRISLSQWEQGTGIPRTRVGGVLESLVSAGILKRTDYGTKRSAGWEFNKYFEQWQGDETVTLQGVSCIDETVTLQGNSSEPSVTLQGVKTVTLQGDNNRKKDNNNIVAAVAVPAEPELSFADRFHAYIERLRQPKANTQAILHEIYIMCFGEAGAPSYGYLGKTAVDVHGSSRLAQLMFNLIAQRPTGDILAYIVAAEKSRQKFAKQNGGNREIKDVVFKNGNGDIYE